MKKEGLDLSNSDSRAERQRKRRTNNRLIGTLISLGSILAILLIAMLVFGSNDKDENEELVADQEENEVDKEEEVENNEDESDAVIEDEDDSEESSDEEDEEELEVEHVDSSDENVIEAFKANWEPIGTSQTEPHTVDFSEDSKDREEMKKAIQVATDLDEMVLWWIGNDGDQKVVATVSTMDEAITYRVYLSWEENHGWKPTLVESLKENDKK